METEGEDGWGMEFLSIAASPWLLMETLCKAVQQEVGGRENVSVPPKSLGTPSYISTAPVCFCLRNFSGHRSKLDVPGAHLPSSNP